METRKSIRDIKTSDSNIISDMVSTQPVVKRRFKKVETEASNESEQVSTSPSSYSEIEQTETFYETKKKTRRSLLKGIPFRKIRGLISEMKPIYLIAFTLIVIGVIVLIFVPSSNNTNDIIEKNKAEAEIVKKKFSKHLVLPQNEEIDIRKITSKMEDPFFKDATIGDYLIIFYKNRIAYIYSIDKDIIINAGVVFIDPKTATTTNKQ